MSLLLTDGGEGASEKEMAQGARVTVEATALTAELGGLQSLLREPIRLASFFLHGHPIYCARWLTSHTVVCVHFTQSPLPTVTVVATVMATVMTRLWYVT